MEKWMRERRETLNAEMKYLEEKLHEHNMPHQSPYSNCLKNCCLSLRLTKEHKPKLCFAFVLVTVIALGVRTWKESVVLDKCLDTWHLLSRQAQAVALAEK